VRESAKAEARAMEMKISFALRKWSRWHAFYMLKVNMYAAHYRRYFHF
jgi:hypothetical protein